MNLNFCKGCDNLQGILLQQSDNGETHTLVYVCKHCGLTEEAAADGNGVIIKSTDYSDDKTSYMQYATPYIEHDPTLPRVSTILCANTNCSKPDDAPQEVIYINYDKKRLKYLYFCVHCKTFWKSGGGIVSSEKEKEKEK